MFGGRIPLNTEGSGGARFALSRPRERPPELEVSEREGPIVETGRSQPRDPTGTFIKVQRRCNNTF
jgi:hypothetical protein